MSTNKDKPKLSLFTSDSVKAKAKEKVLRELQEKISSVMTIKPIVSKAKVAKQKNAELKPPVKQQTNKQQAKQQLAEKPSIAGAKKIELQEQQKQQKQQKKETNPPAKSLAKPLVKKMIIAKEDYSAILGYLQTNYPKCFLAKKKPLPLAVGIHKQILAIAELPFTKSKIRKFLRGYTRGKNYQRSLVVEQPRYNLDGSIASKVLLAEVSKSSITKPKKSNAAKKQESTDAEAVKTVKATTPIVPEDSV